MHPTCGHCLVTIVFVHCSTYCIGLLYSVLFRCITLLLEYNICCELNHYNWRRGWPLGLLYMVRCPSSSPRQSRSSRTLNVPRSFCGQRDSGRQATGRLSQCDRWEDLCAPPQPSGTRSSPGPDPGGHCRRPGESFRPQTNCDRGTLSLSPEEPATERECGCVCGRIPPSVHALRLPGVSQRSIAGSVGVRPS